MRTASIFKNGNNQAVRLPKDMSFEGVSELEISRVGDTITLKPHKPSWVSFAGFAAADEGFLVEREDVVADEERI